MKVFIRPQYTIILLAIILLALTGCSDPYEEKLPLSGIISEEDAKRISLRLKGSDAALFLQWQKRMQRGELMVGEVTPSNIRIALINQVSFNREQEEKTRAEIEKQRRLNQEIAAIKLENEKDNIVNEEIKKRVSVDSLNYRFTELEDDYGRFSGHGWVFNFKFKNLTKETVIGISGYVRIEGAFNDFFGNYPFKLEFDISPGKETLYSPILDYNPNNPHHEKMISSNRLRVSWYFDSMIFSNGLILNKDSLAAGGYFQNLRLQTEATPKI